MSRRGREWLLAHLPHQGAMSLLEGVERWDAERVTAFATRHRETSHPLRRAGELPIAAAIEYGAQAAAAHGALTRGEGARGGLLAGVRAVEFHARRLDDAGERLEVLAEQLGAGEAGVLYRFEVRDGARLLAAGRITVATVDVPA